VGKVTASVNTAHYKGAVTKGVTVTTNDPSHDRLLLQVKAEVVTPIDVQPTDTPALEGKAGGMKPVELTVSSRAGAPFDVLAVKADPRLTVTVRTPGKQPVPRRAHAAAPAGGTTPLASGSSRYGVTIAARRDLPVGRSVAAADLTTTLPGAESVPLRVNLVVLGEVQVTPEAVTFEPSPDGAVRHVRISKPRGAPLRILAVESSSPDFTVTSATVSKGRTYDIAVHYVGKPGRGWVSARTTVRTNEPRQSVIVIPVSGRP